MARNVTSIVTLVKKSKRLLYFTYSFISDHITIDNNNYYYFQLLCKKKYNIKWKTINSKMFVLKIVRIIILVT